MPVSAAEPAHVVVVGAGPAGLAAAERLMEAGGIAVTIVERTPSPARKFLLAGRGGLNLTHSEPLERFLGHYGGSVAPAVREAIAHFTPERLRAWVDGLGEPTFVGSSGRVFPQSFKASPLARAWLARLQASGARLLTRTRWIGFAADGALLVETGGEARALPADAAVLALGGASWSRLGSDGAWTAILAGDGIPVAPLAPMNAGVEIAWSEVVRERFAGTPLKRVAIGVARPADPAQASEAMITRHGLEGTGVYARSAEIGVALDAGGPVALHLDLRPDRDATALAARIAAAPKGRTLTERLRRAGLAPAAIGLMREAGALPADPQALAARAKDCVLAVEAMRPPERAISHRGGVRAEALDDRFMLRARPGIFLAGGVLDWPAPTGGYLLQGCLATGRAAAEGVVQRLARA
ncbi:MAG: TIGR03862 family flavoprotein [Salinarimonas sp.]